MTNLLPWGERHPHFSTAKMQIYVPNPIDHKNSSNIKEKLKVDHHAY